MGERETESEDGGKGGREQGERKGGSMGERERQKVRRGRAGGGREGG